MKYLEKNHYDLIGGITEMINENGSLLYSIKSVPTDPKKLIRHCVIVNVLRILLG